MKLCEKYCGMPKNSLAESVHDFHQIFQRISSVFSKLLRSTHLWIYTYKWLILAYGFGLFVLWSWKK